MHARSLLSFLASTAFLAAALPATASAGLFSSLTSTTKTTTTTAVATTSTTTPLVDLSLIPSTDSRNVKCNTPKTYKAFKAFGDNADYSFAPGGTFENGTAGWSLSGASVVSGNDTSGVYGGSKALRINDGGRVITPWFCVTADNPTFRFTTYGGEVEMEIDYILFNDSDIDDNLVGETKGGSKWGPSAIHDLATEIPDAKLAKGVLARLIWEAEDNVYVDNVLVDPYRRG